MSPYITEERYIADQQQLYGRLDRLTTALETTNSVYMADKAQQAAERAERAEHDLSQARDQNHSRKMQWFGLASAVLAGSLIPTLVQVFTS